MKEILLVLMRDCKWHIDISVGFLVVVVLGIYAVRGFIDYEYIFAALVGYTFFVASIWSVQFVNMPSVDEYSNGAAIFSRWGLILISLSMLLYLILDPLYAS